MIQAVIDRTTDATVLADLARGLLSKKHPVLQEALLGGVQPEHEQCNTYKRRVVKADGLANWPRVGFP